MSEAPLLSVDIAGIPVRDVTFDEVVKLIAGWVADGSGGTVYTPNLHDVVKTHLGPTSALPSWRCGCGYRTAWASSMARGSEERR